MEIQTANPLEPRDLSLGYPPGRQEKSTPAALPRASSEHSPSGQGDPYKGMDSCPIPQIGTPGETCLAPGNGLEADTPTRTQDGLCHPASLQGAPVCLGLYVVEAAGRPISKMFPLGALLMGVDSEVGGQRPGGGETRPSPAAWEQEQLCGTVNNGRGCGGRRVPGLGVGACTTGAGN